MNSVACLDDCEIGLAVAAAEQTARIRTEKVLAIRARLAEGSYNIADRLDAALDRMLEDLLDYTCTAEPLPHHDGSVGQSRRASLRKAHPADRS